MRKEQKEAVYAAQERKEAIIAWVVGLFAAMIAVGILAAGIWLIGKGQGRW